MKRMLLLVVVSLVALTGCAGNANPNQKQIECFGYKVTVPNTWVVSKEEDGSLQIAVDDSEKSTMLLSGFELENAEKEYSVNDLLTLSLDALRGDGATVSPHEEIIYNNLTTYTIPITETVNGIECKGEYITFFTKSGVGCITFVAEASLYGSVSDSYQDVIHTIMLDNNTSTEYKGVREDGTTVDYKEDGDTYTCKEFPRNVLFDGMEFDLDSIDFYEDKVNHGYDLYAVAKFDMRNLTEDDIHWLFKDDDFDMDIRIDSEKNEYDSKRLSRMQAFLDGTTVYVPFYLSDISRYSNAGANYSIFLRIKNGGTYEYTSKDGETSNLDKVDTYHSFDLQIPSDIPTSESIGKELYNHMADCFNDIADFYSSLTE